ncbi:MAG TPA: TonB-dependent receptor plug domain-containing protein [Lacunisphaera sp.]
MKRYPALIACACLALGVQAASAQTAPAAPAEKDVVTLPTFTITETPENPYVSKQALSSSRVAMDIQDIPQTISVVTSEFLQDSMSFRMLDAAKYVTPITESTLPTGGDRYTIRGFQVSHEFVDGMEISGADGYSASLMSYNIDRIEIIKGPNAILVPGGAAGGQMNPITKSPIMKNQGSMTLELAQYKGNALSFDLNRIVSQEKGVAARLVAAIWKNDGYSKNYFRDGFMLAPSLSWQLSPAHKLTVKGEIMQNQETNGVFLPIDPSVGSDDYAIIAKGLPRDWSFGDESDRRDRETERLTLELLSELGQHVSSRLQFTANHVVREDQGTTSGSIAGISITRNPSTGKYEPGKVWTVDQTGAVAIPSSTSVALPDPSTYVYGRTAGSDHLYYNELHFRNDYAIKFDGDAWKSTTIAGLAANGVKTHWRSFPGYNRGNVANNNLAGITYPAWVFAEPSAPANGQNRKAKQTDAQFFVYENLSLLNDRVLLSGGISRFFGTLTRTDTSGVQPTPFPSYSMAETAKSYGVVVKATKEIAVFYSHNTSGGTMPGSLSAGTVAPTFRASVGAQDEYGVKTSFLDGKLTASFAYFDITSSNYAVPNSEFYVLQAQGRFAEAAALQNPLYLDLTSKGWEFEGSYTATPNLTIIGNYTDYKMRQPTGVRLRGVSDKSYGLYADYRLRTGSLKGFGVNLGVDYRSDLVGENVNAYTTTVPLAGGLLVPQQPSFKVADRTIVNLGFTYEAKAWTARLQINNALDEDYILGGINRNSMMVGDPRNFKGSVTYKF